MTAKHLLMHCAKAYDVIRGIKSTTSSESNEALMNKVIHIENVLEKHKNTDNNPQILLLLAQVKRIKKLLDVSAH